MPALHQCKRVLNIGNQVRRTFQSDIETHQLPAMRPILAQFLHAVRYAQAVRTAPAVPNLEQFQAVDKTVGLRLVITSVKYHRKQAPGAGKVTLP